jgi:hypothetical protein
LLTLGVFECNAKYEERDGCGTIWGDQDGRGHYFGVVVGPDEAVCRRVAEELLNQDEEDSDEEDEDSDEDEADEDYDEALAEFGQQCESFAGELNAERARPEGLEDGETRDLFYWSQQDTAWQHQGRDGWEFLGSVAWQNGSWAADWQEHK